VISTPIVDPNLASSHERITVLSLVQLSVNMPAETVLVNVKAVFIVLAVHNFSRIICYINIPHKKNCTYVIRKRNLTASLLFQNLTTCYMFRPLYASYVILCKKLFILKKTSLALYTYRLRSNR
jgi:hypothetical protein